MRVFAVINNTGETWPAMAIARLDSVSGTRYGIENETPVYEIAKPDGEGGIYVVNDAMPLPDGKETTATFIEDADYVRVDSGVTVALQDSVGPINGSWFADFDGDGFLVRDVAGDADIVPVLWDSGTGGSGGSGSTSGCCCCVSVDTPDVVLSDGIETTRIRVLCDWLQAIKEHQTNGTLTLTFPAPSLMPLTKEDAPSDVYRWDFDDTDGVFSAVYNDASDATGDLVSPTGSVTFQHFIASEAGSGTCGCDFMRLRIEWDADIPDPEA